MRPHKQRLERLGGTVKSVAGFLSDAAVAFKDQPLIEALSAAVPWAGVIGEAAIDSFPAVTFVAKLVQGFTEPKEFNDLAWLACSAAYQQAAVDAFSEVGPPATGRRPEELQQDLQHLLDTNADAEHDFGLLSLDQALEHSFVRASNELLEAFVIGAGFNEGQRRKLVGAVQDRFVRALKDIICHRSLMDRYKPLVERLQLGSDEEISKAWLQAHGAYLWRQYHRAPVLKREPYSLADVYIHTECGKLTWKQISGRDGDSMRDHRSLKRLDPAEDGGRHPLLATVLDLIGRKKFHDAIVIQGAAGSGKSAFTLHLANALAERGLVPVRVRLTHLRCKGDVLEDIAQAVLTSDPGDDDAPRLPEPRDLFLGRSLFKERVRAPGSGTEISRHVLILDGWDEISVSASEGFRQRLIRMLDQLRNTVLRSHQDPPVRVILTGRPSPDLADSRFLLKDTPVLTLRPIRPDQLRDFVTRVGELLVQAERLPEKEWPARFRWSLGDLKRYEPLVERYSKEQSSWEPASTLEVLGLPLLTQIALRVIAMEEGDPAALLDNPTRLYRRLIDLTAPHAGKGCEDDAIEGGAYLSGRRLRALLQATAAAITVHGSEEIGHDELTIRLEGLGHDLESEVASIDKHDILHALVISYYFKDFSSEKRSST